MTDPNPIIKPKELLPGQVWVDKNLIYHPPGCGEFPVILLSCDNDLWKAAEFQDWKLGMYIREYTEQDIRKFIYLGNVNEFGNRR